jgi:hypothetical protein
LPVKAPAAAPAAAPIDAARTLPVAAPPMMAPVAAPHAAPWPTGVSQELKKRELTEIPETIRKILVFIESPCYPMNRAQTELLRVNLATPPRGESRCVTA